MENAAETQTREFEGTWEELALREPEFRGRKLLLKVLPEAVEPASQTQETSRSEAEPVRETREAEATYPPAPSARELLNLPPEERGRILAAQAAIADAIYRSDPELTAFEAFGEEDMYDEYPVHAFDK